MVQFDDWVQYVEVFKEESTCYEYFKKIIWKEGEYCPHCGAKKIYHFSNGTLYKCATCKRKFSIKVGTIFEKSPIPLKKWFMAIYLMTCHKKGISSMQLSRDLGVTQKTAWFMLQRLRYAMTKKSFSKPLKNTVEVDETYVGGLEENKHKNKKTKNKDKSRGDKTPVLGMQEREGDLKLFKCEKTDKATIKPIMNSNISSDAKIMTDENPVYNWATNHETVKHTAGQYVNGDATTNRIEGVFSHFKRMITGIYHWCSAKHLQKYSDMFSFRWNTRSYSMQDRINLFFTATVGKRLRYKELISE